VGDPRTPLPTRPPYFWLSVIGALLGLLALGIRVLTLPEGGMRPFLVGVVVALILTAVILGAVALRIRSRQRAAAAAYPDAVLIPIVVGTATSVATRWLAERFAEPTLHLRPSGYATVAIDSAGLHVVSSPSRPHGHIPAAAVTLGPIGRTIIGLREVDALVLDVEAGEQTAPLSLVPMRLRGNPLSTLTDAELLAVTARIEDALAGRPVAPGWGY
jgi:hypothetical protein